MRAEVALAVALIGAAATVAGVLIKTILDRRTAGRDREDRARVAARKLIPELETLRVNANWALRENRPGELTPEQATPEAWTPDTQDALAAAMKRNRWEFVSMGMELIARSLREDFFPKLPPDGTVGQEASVGALNCSSLCGLVLFQLDLLAGDRYWDPNKKLKQLGEHWLQLEKRQAELPELHPEFKAYLEERANELRQRRDELLSQPAAATAPPSA